MENYRININGLVMSQTKEAERIPYKKELESRGIKRVGNKHT